MAGQVNVFDVADYILKSHGSMTTMKLQKLCYYTQAWFLADHGEPLFAEDFAAFNNGPVCYELFTAHRGRYIIAAHDLRTGDATRLTPQQQASVTETLNAYGHMSAAQLSELTHREDPWINAMSQRESGHSDTVSKESMSAYYRSLASSDEAMNVDEVVWPAWLEPSDS